MIKFSLEIDKIMKKLENTFQDASLMKKALLGDARAAGVGTTFI